jgi:hypothetical protein
MRGFRSLSRCPSSNEIDGVTWACAEPHARQSLAIGARERSRASRHHKRLTNGIVDIRLLKPSVDVLRQYSLPNLGLRMITCLIIALLPRAMTSLVPCPSCSVSSAADLSQTHLEGEHWQESHLIWQALQLWVGDLRSVVRYRPLSARRLWFGRRSTDSDLRW